MVDSRVLLSVFTDSKQGERKYMEDCIDINIQRYCDETAECVYLAIFDGHGGRDAAIFAQQHLFNEITRQKLFESSNDCDIMRAIKNGFLSTQNLMWKAYGFWPRTSQGYPSTAGTTATVAIFKRGMLYIAHVGDSTAVVATNETLNSVPKAQCLTEDHKPTLATERKRIEDKGGLILEKAGVKRVVWKRPRVVQFANTGLLFGEGRRTTVVDEVPFLAVSRSLGDLWSFNSACSDFVVSPEPDVLCMPLEPERIKMLILASDGLWNVVRHQEAASMTHNTYQLNTENPAEVLTTFALGRWASRGFRADNTSVIWVSLAAHPVSSPVITLDGALTVLVASYVAPNTENSESVFLTPEDSERENSCGGPLKVTMLTYESGDDIFPNSLGSSSTSSDELLNESWDSSSVEVVHEDTNHSTDVYTRLCATLSSTRKEFNASKRAFANDANLSAAAHACLPYVLPSTPNKTLCAAQSYVSPRSFRVLQRLRTRVSFPPLNQRLSNCTIDAVSEQRPDQECPLPQAAITKAKSDLHVLDNLPINHQAHHEMLTGKEQIPRRRSSVGIQNRCPMFVRKRRTSYGKLAASVTIKKFCLLQLPNQKLMSYCKPQLE